MRSLKGKTIFITGSSRGIGKAIAMKAAADGANIVVIGKTKEPHPKLPGTVYTAAEEIKHAGGEVLPIIADVRFEDQVQNAVDKTIDVFGGIDILVNNASAISLTSTIATSMKRFDLMFSVNVRATFMTSKLCIPHLKKGSNPHILMLSPPLSLEPQWFKNNLAYTMSKYGMSMSVLGLAEELKDDGIAVNSLWPRTAIDTAAVRNLLGGKATAKRSRKPEIVADAAYYILTESSREVTGNFFIDDEVLMKNGICNLEQYSVTPNSKLMRDFFLLSDGENYCE
ncbi:L-rhamnose 1-dehydrogenase (NADP(+)) [Candidatus Lokiarchaeum ossiferum]|uniref:L-rhamnose 1-dehydrogenase (NADP(+)) n=1 Tax=Candidatus Lokiarchaeum ossiferum TaxID=2951803 RepID=A0ABY6HMV4_9ARCH|nr:L-rhamnose 1-dehydrogenase (NADP(+)) [Candidatus Lokiarchaeum sp. B-35]